MSTLNVGTIASKTGNSSITIADNGNATFTNWKSFIAWSYNSKKSIDIGGTATF